MADSTGRTLSTGSGNSPDLVYAAFDWLARSQDNARKAHDDWREHGLTLLPVGSRFNSVCLNARIMRAAVGSDDLEVTAATLAQLLDGPVIHGRPKNQFHALTEVYPVSRWTCPEAPMLGKGHYVTVPASDLRGPTGLYWAVPPRVPGDLCAVQAIASLVAIARSSSQGRPW
ncbi:hypothetical protein [Streptomyces sp. NPDC052114]|uniref:hypothetical protein n=1 Tax=unclassified Streptomyces TaxID=2593676 RepID=UPI00343C2126